MAKIKLKPIIKHHEGDTYKFIAGVALVPGMCLKRKPITITLTEFNELIRR